MLPLGETAPLHCAALRRLRRSGVNSGAARDPATKRLYHVHSECCRSTLQQTDPGAETQPRSTRRSGSPRTGRVSTARHSPSGTRLLAPRINPPHAPKALQSGMTFPDRLQERFGGSGVLRGGRTVRVARLRRHVPPVPACTSSSIPIR
jgi:hypothetical protein